MRVLRRLRPDRRGWCGKLLLPAADPRRVFAGSARREGMLVEEVRAARAEIADAGSRLEAQIADGRRKLALLEAQVQKNALGDPDRHSRPLQRRAARELETLESTLALLRERGEELSLAEQRLESESDAMRARRAISEAHATTTAAQARVERALGGRPTDLITFADAVDRSEPRHSGAEIARAQIWSCCALAPTISSAATDPTQTCGAASKRCGRRCGRSIRSIWPDSGCCDACAASFPWTGPLPACECLSSTRCARSPSRSRST